MDAVRKEQSPRPAASSGSKLRYPLRSSARAKQAPTPAAVADTPGSSASRRARPPSSVSQSVNVLNLSAKEKSAKLPRRFSIPTKSTFGSHQSSVGSNTPISESGLKRSTPRAKSDTPLSDVSKSSSRRRFCVLSSISYWLTQIKLSESASKHSVSLGFFKLALESGCEPLQRMREELKSYMSRHNLLVELEESAKDLLQSYNVLQDMKQLKLSENSNQLQELETSASILDSCHSTASAGNGNLKPNSLFSTASSVTVLDRNEVTEKRGSMAKDRNSTVKNLKKPISVKDANGNSLQKKSPKTKKVGPKGGHAKVKNSVEVPVKEGDLVNSLSCGEVSHEDKDISDDKENVDSQSIDGAEMKDGIQAC